MDINPNLCPHLVLFSEIVQGLGVSPRYEGIGRNDLSRNIVMANGKKEA